MRAWETEESSPLYDIKKVAKDRAARPEKATLRVCVCHENIYIIKAMKHTVLNLWETFFGPFTIGCKKKCKICIVRHVVNYILCKKTSVMCF